MVFKVKPKAATPAASIKDGTYRATVSNLKQFANTYGERIGFEFTINRPLNFPLTPSATEL
jgi:hypothetical protein